MEAGAWSVITVSLFVKRNNNNTLQFYRTVLEGIIGRLYRDGHCGGVSDGYIEIN